MINIKKSGVLAGDIVIIVVVVIVAVSMLAVFAVSGNQGANTAVIYIDGEAFKKYPLDANAVIGIERNGIDMTVEISGGAVRVSRSNCKNQSCVKSGFAKTPNQIIACIPNGVYILIEDNDGGEEAERDFDAIIG